MAALVSPRLLLVLRYLAQGYTIYRPKMGRGEVLQAGKPGGGGDVVYVRAGTIGSLLRRDLITPSPNYGIGWAITDAGRAAVAAADAAAEEPDTFTHD